MIKFTEWLQKKLNEVGAATGVVMGNPCKKPDVGPDAQIEGDPVASCKAMKKKQQKR
jgi:hypothetical protein